MRLLVFIKGINIILIIGNVAGGKCVNVKVLTVFFISVLRFYEWISAPSLQIDPL